MLVLFQYMFVFANTCLFYSNTCLFYSNTCLFYSNTCLFSPKHACFTPIHVCFRQNMLVFVFFGFVSLYIPLFSGAGRQYSAVCRSVNSGKRYIHPEIQFLNQSGCGSCYCFDIDDYRCWFCFLNFSWRKNNNRGITCQNF